MIQSCMKYRKQSSVFLLLIMLMLASCSKAPDQAQVKPYSFTFDPFLDTLQQRSFLYFWEATNPRNGLTNDRTPTKAFASIAANGFGMTCYLVGAERGWISRQQAAERTLTTLEFFWNAPQNGNSTGVTGYKGFFYHFLDMDTGERFKNIELSTIDTGLLLMGMLSAQTYFDGNTSQETRIRALVDSIYRRVDWQWFAPRPPVLSMGWHPEQGFNSGDWRGYNEAMLLYVLAFASPTHPISPEAWKLWTKEYLWTTYRNQEHVNFGPLFGHQYSHVWIDFRGIKDEYMQAKGIDYFENSRRATYANWEYCKANPGKWKDYGAEIWGLTACDGPKDTIAIYSGTPTKFTSYNARGAAQGYIVDDGTIAPTSAGGSIAFAPDICIPALKAMRAKYGDKLFSRYGFVDAFNPSYTFGAGNEQGWFDVDYLGIDQGPIVLMIENYRNDFVWNLMKKNPYVVDGLKKAGFTGGWLK